MAHPAGQLPRLPVCNRVFWLDPALGEPTRTRVSRQLQAHGGQVHPGIDLHDSRRGWPGTSEAETQAEAISGGSIATLYLSDLYSLLAPRRCLGDEFLRRGQAVRDTEDTQFPWSTHAEIDLAGADL